jgi:hypothetical protein
MNCKLGDIAVSVGSRNRGRIMDILALAPLGRRFSLPNGVWHSPVHEPSWVVKLLDGPMRCGFKSGDNVAERSVWIGVARDAFLRPLRDPDEETEIEEECCASAKESKPC